MSIISFYQFFPSHFQVDKLLNCCFRRKSFVVKLFEKQLEACLLLALRGNSACQMALCLMLEWNLVKEPDQQIQITTTLQSTDSGKLQYNMLCKRQQHLKKIVSPVLKFEHIIKFSLRN